MPAVPRIRFLHENVGVDAEPGQSIREVAIASGVEIHRGFWARRNVFVRLILGLLCGGRGLCGACEVWAAPSSPGALSPPTFWERLRQVRGTKRLACQGRVHGDVEVQTLPGGPPRAQSLDAYAVLPPAKLAAAPPTPVAAPVEAARTPAT